MKNGFTIVVLGVCLAAALPAAALAQRGKSNPPLRGKRPVPQFLHEDLKGVAPIFHKGVKGVAPILHKGAKGVAPALPPVLDPPELDRIYEVEVEVRFEKMEAVAKFVVTNATQSNYVVKNADGRVFIVNLLPVALPFEPELIATQVQIELSIPNGGSFQMQTEIRAKVGKKSVVADSPDARATLLFREKKARK